MTETIDHAFVLAAGLGTRLKPYTDRMPKPMVPLLGKPLLGYIFDHLKRAGVQKIVINTHHMPDQIRDYIATRTDLLFSESYEPELLETGGGIRKALHILGQKPFFAINGDAFWTEGTVPALIRLAQTFDSEKMDLLMLMQPVNGMNLTEGVGDYNISPEGRPIRLPEKGGTHMFAGVRVIHPRLFAGTQPGKFSFLSLMDKAEAENRLYAIEHEGEWHHISTPEDLENVDAHLRARGA